VCSTGQARKADAKVGNARQTSKLSEEKIAGNAKNFGFLDKDQVLGGKNGENNAKKRGNCQQTVEYRLSAIFIIRHSHHVSIYIIIIYYTQTFFILLYSTKRVRPTSNQCRHILANQTVFKLTDSKKNIRTTQKCSPDEIKML
jgi:hypothetical protein